MFSVSFFAEEASGEGSSTADKGKGECSHFLNSSPAPVTWHSYPTFLWQGFPICQKDIPAGFPAVHPCSGKGVIFVCVFVFLREKCRRLALGRLLGRVTPVAHFFFGFSRERVQVLCVCMFGESRLAFFRLYGSLFAGSWTGFVLTNNIRYLPVKISIFKNKYQQSAVIFLTHSKNWK